LRALRLLISPARQEPRQRLAGASRSGHAEKKKPGVAGLSRRAMRGVRADRRSTLDRFLVPALDLVPVDHVVERADVVRATVLVFQVVGVLPHVQAEDRGVARADALHERAVLVGAALHRELAGLVDAQPRPAAAE